MYPHNYLDALILELGLFYSSVLNLLTHRVFDYGLIIHGVIGVVMRLISSAGSMAWISII